MLPRPATVSASPPNRSRNVRFAGISIFDDLREEPRQGRDRVSVGCLPDDDPDRPRVLLEVQDVLREVPSERLVREGPVGDALHHRMPGRGIPCLCPLFVQDRGDAGDGSSRRHSTTPSSVRPARRQLVGEHAPDVHAHQPFRLVGVVRGDRVDDRGVLLDRCLHPAGDALRELADPREMCPQVLDQRADALVRHLGIDEHVELLEQARESPEIAGLAKLAAANDQVAQRAEGLRRRPLRGRAGGRPFEQRPQLVDLVEVALGVARDDRALEGRRFDQALLLEPREGLPERRLAHPELLGERRLPQRVAGPQPELDDRLSQLLRDPVRHLPAVGTCREHRRNVRGFSRARRSAIITSPLPT